MIGLKNLASGWLSRRILFLSPTIMDTSALSSTESIVFVCASHTDGDSTFYKYAQYVDGETDWLMLRASSYAQVVTWILHRNEQHKQINLGQVLRPDWFLLIHSLLNLSDTITSIEQLHRFVPDEPMRDLCMFVLTFVKSYRAGINLSYWDLVDEFVSIILKTDGAYFSAVDISTLFLSPREIYGEASNLINTTTDNTLGGSTFNNVLSSIVCLGWGDLL
ncbi:hypothetical protein CYLTODRAFT_99894 [Cylindrobasidium torrendii FP15055 ss-10]|uniref:Uncharacterized protein n=1 Tax=Cylindrobasidium torrendii FP15055 ss-10 TaxID=1314674 RepID=A0A0D7B4S0_9AGAR|nr:hypothetical protein CYLTODRAFT_99894 [Cylindrobasidium torrendii FP15055 ss-10]